MDDRGALFNNPDSSIPPRRRQASRMKTLEVRGIGIGGQDPGRLPVRPGDNGAVDGDWTGARRGLAMTPIGPAAFSLDDDRWGALERRDARADGAFVYAVRTTGVYCRPTCGSRRPNRANVLFFDGNE